MNKSVSEFPADLAADIDAYEAEASRFLSGEMPAAVFKAKRVPMGVYEQRQDGTYMVRVRVTAGRLNADQALTIADLSRTMGDGALHITTRQDVQLHSVGIKDTPRIMKRLLEQGLTTRGGGGNTVRNVTACPYAGICPQEFFDVTEYADAVTGYLIRLTGSYNLPRKYKISFSGCPQDCGLAQISDLGFVAMNRDGRRGFRVFAAGGMGAGSRIASLLLEWTPAQEVIRIAEAVRRLFDRHGDRRNKNRARLRFVIDRLGKEEFRRVFNDEMKQVIEDGVPQYHGSGAVVERSERGAAMPLIREMDGLLCLEQRQAGWLTVPLHPELGLISAEDLVGLAELASRFSAEKGLRTTRAQGIQIRSIKSEDLPSIAAGLQKLNPAFHGAGDPGQFTSCAGAATCRLGLCLSRNAVSACAAKLRASGLDRKALEGFTVNVNGCPNSCGHQPIAQIGFSGAAQRVNGRLVPFYKLTMGGLCNSRGARFGSLIGQLPAKALPDFINEVAVDFAQHRGTDAAFSDYFERTGQAHFKEILKRYAAAPSFEERPDFYRDFGSEELFSLAGRGAG